MSSMLNVDYESNYYYLKNYIFNAMHVSRTCYTTHAISTNQFKWTINLILKLFFFVLWWKTKKKLFGKFYAWTIFIFSIVECWCEYLSLNQEAWNGVSRHMTEMKECHTTEKLYPNFLLLSERIEWNIKKKTFRHLLKIKLTNPKSWYQWNYSTVKRKSWIKYQEFNFLKILSGRIFINQKLNQCVLSCFLWHLIIHLLLT